MIVRKDDHGCIPLSFGPPLSEILQFSASPHFAISTMNAEHLRATVLNKFRFGGCRFCSCFSA